MTLQERIVKDLRNSIKSSEEDLEKYYSLKVIVGEIQRAPKKELSDDEVIKILKTLQKYEIENITRAEMATSDYLEIIEYYLPEQIAEEEIIKWIKLNIDFSKFKNKLQAVSPTMREFGNSTSGSIVKKIITENF